MEEIRWVAKPEAYRLLKIISHSLSARNVQSYLVGGYVRDLLLGRDTADIDIAVSGDAPLLAREMAGCLDGKYMPLDEQNGVYRVILPENEWQVDFTKLKGDIQDDLAGRDFTVDAMAFPLEDVEEGFTAEKLLDPCHGYKDLLRREIKAVSEDVFKVDSARLLRAVRIAAELRFNIDRDTEKLIQHDAALVSQVAGERVREEFIRLLAVTGAGQRLFYLDRLGLLTALIPEMAPSRGAEQPWIHFWDVFTHSVQTVSAVEFLLREGTCEFANQDVLSAVPWSETISRHFDQAVGHGSTRRSMLKLAALFHDIAKPQTRTIDDDGRARFLGHPVQGAAEAASIMERLRFSNREIHLVELLVKYHLRPMQMSNEGMPTHRAIYRFFRDTGEAGIDLLFLCLADHLATRGPLLDSVQWQEHNRMTGYVLARHIEEGSASRPFRLIDGHDIINIFGLEPGPEIGKLLEAVRESRAAGEVTSRRQALDYVKSLISGEKIYPQEGRPQGEK
jgi:poly(A) polymerase